MTVTTLVDLLRRNHTQEPEPGNVVPFQPAADSDGARRYALRALHDECETVSALPEGQRNHGLNRAAFKLGQHIGAGNLTRDEVDQALTAAAQTAGLPLHEIRQVLRVDKATSALTAGSTIPRAAPDLVGTSTVTEVNNLTPTTETNDGDDQVTDRERTSWWPTALTAAAAAAATEPEPQFLTRSDGQCLAYAGKVNGLIGESESGKSWVALLAVQQALHASAHVLFLDFEDNPATIKSRLDLMSTDNLHLLDYAHPDEALGVLQAEDLNDAIGHGYDLIVVDGVNAAMTLLGYDINSNVDATLFNRKVLTQLTRNGAGVLTVDHVPKNTENRAKGGIGAQAKRAMMDGCCLTVEIDKPFGRGLSGTLKLWVDKDRTGHVRGAAGGGRFAGRVHLNSHDDTVEMTIDAPDDDHEDGSSSWQPTYLMEQVSKLLQDVPDGLSTANIEKEVKGRRDTVRQALAALIDGGWVARHPGPRNAIVHRLVTAYSEGDRTPTTDLAPPRPDLAPGDVESTSPQPLRSRAGGARSDQPSGEVTTPGEVTPCDKCHTPVPTRTHQTTTGYCLDCADILGIYVPPGLATDTPRGTP